MEPTPKNYSHLTIPAAIVIAGAIIALAIIFSGKPAASTATNSNPDDVKINVSPITINDHILGNPNAPIRIVEYSDPSCPFCKMFNPYIVDIIGKYGPSGQVAWIYRHFPLDKPGTLPDGGILHPNAGHEAQSMECAFSIGGADKFWLYEKALYTKTPSVTPDSPNGLDQKQLPVIAKSVGIDVAAFNNCLSSGSKKDIVEKDYLSGLNAGVSGTPSSFMILTKPAGLAVDQYIAASLTKYNIPSSLLFTSSDKKTIAMIGALPEELITGLISAVQSNQ